MKIYPAYPKPLKNKASLFITFFKQGRSWLDALAQRSYNMKMGHVKLPGINIYIINQPNLIHHVLVSHVKSFPKSFLLAELLNPLLGESIFTSNGKIWKKQRELLAPSFDMVKISHVFDLMHEASEDMIVRLNQHKDGTILNIDKEMTYVTADIIFRTILSEKLDEKQGKKLLEAFELFQEETLKTAMRKIFLLPDSFSIFTGEKKRIQAGKFIRNNLANIIRPRYDEARENKQKQKQDILASLLQVIDTQSQEPFSFDEILDQVSMLFLAGHETTASSMSWALYLLALYPEHQEKAYLEVNAICGDKPFTSENIKQLTFITNIFKETLRLYPPVGYFARESSENTVMRNKNIHEGDSIVVSPWLMHRNSLYWEDPHMFDPYRFENEENIIKNTYLPFGMGQRICIGASFAMQESILLLASMLRNYAIELKPEFSPDVVGRLTIRSANGIHIKLNKREKTKQS